MQLASTLGEKPPTAGASVSGPGPSGFEGRVLRGTYRILRLIGRGAMGLVFEAQHLRLYRRVAIKLLPPGVLRNDDLRERFEREAELVSRIQHRNVVSVLDSDVTDEGEPFLVLELLEGESLLERMGQGLPMAVSEAVSIATQVALGLAAAHRADIIHRDLKPENVFLLEERDGPGGVKLLDFGIGRSLRSSRPLTSGATIVGTPEYMAPEQAAGLTSKIDARADQHALAVLTYELLTGVQPFNTEDLAETLRNVMTLKPPPASTHSRWLSPELDRVLGRALAKEPEERYPDVATFARALVRAAGRATTSGTLPRPKATSARVTLLEAGTMPADMSPRSAYLLSRIETGMSVADVLDVAGMPGGEAEQRLAGLVVAGLVAIEKLG